MESDGREAKGHIDLPGNVVNIDVDFSYIQTDIEQGLRIHPKMHFTDKVRKFLRLHKNKQSKQDNQAKQDNQDKQQNDNGYNDNNKQKK